MAKVLLVEDDNNLREIYQARLMAEGYDIVAAQNGEEALVVAKQNKPDLIISDVMMPRISGFEMLDILRNTEELKHTKVIMLTALGQAEDQKRASGLGADKYLVKSQVTLEDIVNAAKELLGETAGIAEVPPAPAPPDPLAADAPAPIAPLAATAPAVEPPVAAVASAPITVPDLTTPATPPAPPTSVTPDPAVAAEPPVTMTQAATPTATPPEPLVTPADPAAATPPSLPPAPVIAPVTLVPEPPAIPEPAAPVISMPGEAVPPPPIMPDPTTPPATPAATAETSSQTLATEGAAVQAQIDTYAQAAPDAAVAVQSEQQATESNNETIAAAVQQLNTPPQSQPIQPPTVTPATPPAPPTSVTPDPAADANDNTVTVAGKKVIQPITNPADKPDLNALLAKEEANAPAAPAPVVGAPMTQAATPTATPPEPAHLPGQSFDPTKAL